MFNNLVKNSFKISIIIILFFVVYYACFYIATSNKTLSENSNVLDNPSRGFYTQVDSSNTHFFEYMPDDIRLILLAYNLEDYKDCEIPKGKLDELETFLSQGAEYGVKIIFRAAYGFTSDAYYNDNSDLELLETHILQIAPIINKYKNVLHCVQAGFIGPWGEWHSSLLLDDKSDSEQTNTRTEIVNLLLTNIDSTIPIGLRRPSFIREASDAGLDTMRLCIHNDGLFGSESDLGTYDKERSDAITEWNSIIGAATNGGEMPSITEWTTPDSVNNEMYQMKISYLNAYYNTEVLDSWKEDTFKDENAFTYISNHLGYRFYISEITSIDYISPRFISRRIPLSLTLSNSGYSEIEDSYQMEVLIQSGETILETIEINSLSSLNVDSPLVINTTLRLNAEILENGISIGLKIYDNENNGNLLYHVALANDEVTYVDGINWIKLL